MQYTLICPQRSGQTNEINEVQCGRIWPQCSTVKSTAVLPDTFFVVILGMFPLLGNIILSRGHICIAWINIFLVRIKYSLTREIRANRLAMQCSSFCKSLIRIWLQRTLHVDRPQGKLPLYSRSCQEFHFPAMKFINNLFNHPLLHEWSDDYLQTPNCHVNESRITDTWSWS